MTKRRRHASGARGVGSLCSDLGHSPATVATAWLMQAPGVTAPIVGPRTEAQLDAALEAVDLELDADMLDRID